MSNTITITNRGDSSQSIGETNKLIARIAVLEDRLTKLTDKSSKQADMMGKGYASAEARVKHFEQALKNASNVKMKFAALEGLQQASREFKVAKADFEASVKLGHSATLGDVNMIGRLGAWQQSSKPSPMIAMLDAHKSQQQENEAAARRQEMLDRDAGVRERQMRIARARELDAKYGSRAVAESFDASNRRGSGLFDSENAMKDRRALLQDRKAGLSPSSESYQKTIDELRQIEVMLKRINAKPMKAVELGSPEALNQQIKYLQAEMAKVGSGPQWDKLNGKLAAAKTQLGSMQQKARDAEKALSQSATAPMGSWVRLEYELEKAKRELSLLTYGTKEFIAQQSKVAGLQKEWDNVNTAVNKTNKSQKESDGMMGSLIGQAKTLAMSYFGVHSAMQLVTTEYQKWKDFNLGMADEGILLETEIVKQAANIDAADRPEARRWAVENAENLIAKPEDTYALLGTAMSSGGETLARSKKLVGAVSPLVLGDREQALGLAIASGVITSENQSDDFNAGAIQVRQFGQRSMGIDETQFDKNTMKAMAAFMRKNRKVDAISSERALELIAETSHIIKDVEGDKSATSIISELGAFNVFNPKASGKLKSGEKYKIDPQVIKAFNESRNFDERIQMLRDNKMLGEQFIDSMRRGLPQSMAMGMLDTSPKAVEKRKWVEEGIDSFAVAGTKWEAEAKSIKDSAPQLYERRVREATSSAAKQRTGNANEAEAWKTYEDMFTKDKINLTGIDSIATTKAYIAMQHDRTVQAEKIKWNLAKQGEPVPQGDIPVNEARAFRIGAESLLKGEVAAGGRVNNKAVVEILEQAVASLRRQEEKLDVLNNIVAAGRGGQNAAPRQVMADPKLRIPPVPRVPIAIGRGNADPLGMRKR